MVMSSTDKVAWIPDVFRQVRWQSLVAGTAGGLASTLALHPLDLVKVRFQVDEGTGVTKRPKYRGLGDALRSIVRTHGFTGLYQGLVPNMWGAGLSWGLYFFIYNAIKRSKQSGDSTFQLTPGQHMLSAGQAGALTLLVTNPIWVTKTRLCLQYDAQIRGIHIEGGQYRGMGHALLSIARKEGVLGLYRGLLPGLFGTSHGALQFMAYEEMKNRYNIHYGIPIDGKLSSLEYLVFAALSKIFAAASTYPYQVVRSRLQDQHRVYGGVGDVLRQIWRYEGFYGYYKGLWPSLLRVTPACCITFVVYENLITWL